MRRIIICALALLVLSSGVWALERFVPASGSLVRVEGTSTLHDWKMEGTTILGKIDLTDPATKAATVSVAIPVTSIRSEHSKMDRLMSEALKAKDHPEIKYEMTRGTRENGNDENFVMRTAGKLTIAGVTRDVSMDVMARRNGHGTYILSGSAPVRMTDYGIKPPKAMMNTIKTGDDVKITFRWVVAAN
jgi:polyisoprenoid-binding protein YceI